MRSRISWGSCENADPGGLWWGLRFCISDKGPGNADAAGLWTWLGGARDSIKLGGWALCSPLKWSELSCVKLPPPPYWFLYPQLFPEFSLPCAGKACAVAPVLPGPFSPLSSCSGRVSVGFWGPPGSQACGSRLTVPSPWRADARINSLSERSATRSANPVCIFRVCSISYLTCRVAPPLSGEVPARYQQGMFFLGLLRAAPSSFPSL